MPQPLPNNITHIEVTSSQEVIDQRPELALVAAKVISAWPRLETALGVLFITMLHGDPKPTAAVYNSIRNNQAQRDAFVALSEVALTDQEERDILAFILKRYASAAKSRDVIAHHLWGIMPEFPDAIIMMNPKGSSAATAALYGAVTVPSSAQRAAFDVFDIYKESSQIWKKEDFKDALDRIERVVLIAMTFMAMRPNPQRPLRDEKARQQLLSFPEVQEHMLRCAQNRKKSP